MQNLWFVVYSTLRREFCNYAVGPWVSVAGRETALARGNPAIRKEFSDLEIYDREICLGKSLNHSLVKSLII
ncbi:MAG: hypothetical protein AUG90_01710 [Verrucomicrobia bacterium 13_1_20CM_4_55_9]|nr:MAG: hypothetical protein AUG90_01710 [Verrucomicrobia bacterium 13_1_20CM_4_55_9]PYJ81248.1 MAG: hypothetical protein DME73_07915 [Verrucomicrobiota bacterium]PYL95246.1 MAG: hypothetical protein DMF18_08680 [Verrucomicrobiota bacterium]